MASWDLFRELESISRDMDNVLRGVFTADTSLDVQTEEATEDMYRMVGLAEEESLFRPLRQSMPPRLGWLYINLITAFLAASTVSLFEGTIAKVAVLAVFIVPSVVAGSIVVGVLDAGLDLRRRWAARRA